ncbi:MAG: alpha/beta hydrolase [Streptosporangiaceae bacterium]
MVTASRKFDELSDEFALVGETAAEAGLDASVLPQVRRGWVNVPTGGHVSALFWGSGAPEIVFLHDRGESARVWDAVALAAGRPSVAIDLPGHGRSDWRRDGRYEPGKLAPAIVEAIRSFAPRAGLVAGSGLGALTAIEVGRRQPALLRRLAIVGALPGSTRCPQRTGGERFASREEAFAVLASRWSSRSQQALRREVLYEIVSDPDGSWVWRHHPGNLPVPAPADSRWDLKADAPVTLIRGDWSAPSDPGASVITIPRSGEDIIATQPVALAAALVRLLCSPSQPAPTDLPST